jgi:hypothetical protein
MNRNEIPEDVAMNPERVNAMREVLLLAIQDEPQLRARRIRRRIAILAGVGILVTGGAVTAGVMVLQSSQVSNTELVHCLSSTDRNPDGTYPGSQATIASGEGPGRVDDALALCTQMWQQGVLQKGFEPTEPNNSPGTLPTLQLCVMGDGSAAVVPSDTPSICQTIGLAPLGK